jgi:hypothetical protein
MNQQTRIERLTYMAAKAMFNAYCAWTAKNHVLRQGHDNIVKALTEELVQLGGASLHYSITATRSNKMSSYDVDKKVRERFAGQGLVRTDSESDGIFIYTNKTMLPLVLLYLRTLGVKEPHVSCDADAVIPALENWPEAVSYLAERGVDVGTLMGRASTKGRVIKARDELGKVCERIANILPPEAIERIFKVVDEEFASIKGAA